MARRGQGAGCGVQGAGKRKECPDCGSTKFEHGTLALYNSISYLVFSSEKNRFVTLGNSLKARVCLGCGRLELFAPPGAFKKKSANKTGGRVK